MSYLVEKAPSLQNIVHDECRLIIEILRSIFFKFCDFEIVAVINLKFRNFDSLVKLLSTVVTKEFSAFFKLN